MVDAVRTGGARHALLGGLIDHAALFPPASLTAPDALREDARVRGGEEAWLVGRFVVPSSRLAELGDAAIPLSVVLDDAGVLLEDPRMEAVELPPALPAGIAVPVSEVYVERPLDELEWLAEVASLGRRAKARCGGAVVPTVAALAAFVRRCRRLGVPFKATAGLHHAVAAPGRHGFLNLLAAAVFGDEEHALAEHDPAAFGVDPDGFTWRDRSAGADEVALVRRELLVGFGSCSIAEPAAELRALGIL